LNWPTNRKQMNLFTLNTLPIKWFTFTDIMSWYKWLRFSNSIKRENLHWKVVNNIPTCLVPKIYLKKKMNSFLGPLKEHRTVHLLWRSTFGQDCNISQMDAQSYRSQIEFCTQEYLFFLHIIIRDVVVNATTSTLVRPLINKSRKILAIA
jgi:hypothetical protein